MTGNEVGIGIYPRSFTNEIIPEMNDRPRKCYRFLTGPDEAAFCQRVSDALADGYVLYGDPVMLLEDGVRIVGQAICLPEVHPQMPIHQNSGRTSE